MHKTSFNLVTLFNLVMDELKQPAQVAKELGVDGSTVRRWLAWHKDHLSESAKPAVGGRRKLTFRDIEVLRRVAELRDQGLNTDQINEKLAQTAFSTLSPPGEPEAPQNDTEEQPAQASPIVPIDAQTLSQPLIEALVSLPARVDALESTKIKQQLRIEFLEAQRLKVDVVFIAIAAFIAGLIVGLAVWWFQ